MVQMKFLALLICIVFSMPGIAGGIACKVIGVSDGDTLTCLSNSRQQIKVRLAQIDAPEKAQAFGQQSKQSLAAMVFGQQVTLEVETRDKYGRTVARVLKGKEDINLAQIGAGMAWVYVQYARVAHYFTAQDKARGRRVGLWVDATPVAPWDWRHGTKAHNTGKATPSLPRGECGRKHTCKAMATCEEATHYLKVCGLQQLDRDGDGVPCESLCR